MTFNSEDFLPPSKRNNELYQFLAGMMNFIIDEYDLESEDYVSEIVENLRIPFDNSDSVNLWFNLFVENRIGTRSAVEFLVRLSDFDSDIIEWFKYGKFIPYQVDLDSIDIINSIISIPSAILDGPGLTPSVILEERGEFEFNSDGIPLGAKSGTFYYVNGTSDPLLWEVYNDKDRNDLFTFEDEGDSPKIILYGIPKGEIPIDPFQFIIKFNQSPTTNVREFIRRIKEVKSERSKLISLRSIECEDRLVLDYSRLDHGILDTSEGALVDGVRVCLSQKMDSLVYQLDLGLDLIREEQELLRILVKIINSDDVFETKSLTQREETDWDTGKKWSDPGTWVFQEDSDAIVYSSVK